MDSLARRAGAVPPRPTSRPTHDTEDSSDFNVRPTRPTRPSLSIVFPETSGIARETAPALTALTDSLPLAHMDLKIGGTGGTGGTNPATSLVFARPIQAARWAGWDDLDLRRQRWREAPDVAARREVIAAWAEAAGGEVAHGTLRLPSGLPRRLARAEVTANAGYVGLTVAELSPPRCAWCPNPAEPGSGLCDHCGWLAGPALHPPPPGLSR